MPALSPLFAHGGVLSTPDRRHGVIAGHTDVASDALADVVDVPVLDLSRQEGVGDGGTGGARHVEDSAPDLRPYGVRRRKAADTDHGFGSDGLYESDEFFLKPFGRETRGL